MDVIEPTSDVKAVLWRVVRFPLIRVILGFVAVLVPVLFYQMGLEKVTGGVGSKSTLFPIAVLPLCALALIAY